MALDSSGPSGITPCDTTTCVLDRGGDVGALSLLGCWLPSLRLQCATAVLFLFCCDLTARENTKRNTSGRKRYTRQDHPAGSPRA